MGGLADAIINALLGLFETLVTAFQEFLADKVIQPFLDFVTYTPRPMHNGEFAIVNPPTNGVWPTIYDGYMQNLALAYVILFVGVMVTNAAATVSIVSPYTQQRTKHSAVTTAIILPLSWPFAAFILHSFYALTDILLQGVDLTGLLTTLLAAFGAASAIPAVNVISTILGVLDLAVLLIALIIYIFRIMFLLLVMYGLPLLVVFRFAGIPIVEGIADRVLRLFVQLAFLPVLVALGFQISSHLFNSAGDLVLSGLTGAVTGVLQVVFAFVIPVMTIVLYYLALQGTLGRTATKAASSAKKRYGGTTAMDTDPGQKIAKTADEKLDHHVGRRIRTSAAHVKQASTTAINSVRQRRADPHAQRVNALGNQMNLEYTAGDFVDAQTGDARFMTVGTDDQESSYEYVEDADGKGVVEIQPTGENARKDVREAAVNAARQRAAKKRRQQVRARELREQRQEHLREKYGQPS